MWLVRYALQDKGIYALATENEPCIFEGRIVIYGEYIEFFDPLPERCFPNVRLKPGEIREVESITFKFK